MALTPKYNLPQGFNITGNEPDLGGVGIPIDSRFWVSSSINLYDLSETQVFEGLTTYVTSSKKYFILTDHSSYTQGVLGLAYTEIITQDFTGSFNLSGSINLSGSLTASELPSAGGGDYSTVVWDNTTGEFYSTGSYGGGAGTSGTDGTSGTSGTSGTDGTSGTSGTSGTDGADGASAVSPTAATGVVTNRTGTSTSLSAFNTFTFDGSSQELTLSGSFLVSGSIVPNVPSGEFISSFDLGSDSAAWRDIYVSSGSVRFIEQIDNRGSFAAVYSSFTKADLDNLQLGKPITSASKTIQDTAITFPPGTWSETNALLSQNDSRTYISLGSNNISFYATGITGPLAIIRGNTNSIRLGASSGTDVEVTGDLTAVTGSLDFILVNSNIIPSGNLISDLGNDTNKFRTASLDRVESSNIEINTSGSSPFLIKIEDEPKFEINNEGVAVLGNMTSLPTAITGGLYYSNGSFYMGIE